MTMKITTKNSPKEIFVDYLPDGRVFLGWSENIDSLSTGFANLNFTILPTTKHKSIEIINVPNPYYQYDQSFLWGAVAQQSAVSAVYENDVYVAYGSNYNGGAINIFLNSISVDGDTIVPSEAIRYFDYDPGFQQPRDIYVNSDGIFFVFLSPHDEPRTHQSPFEVRVAKINHDLTYSEHSLEVSEDSNGNFLMKTAVGENSQNIFWLDRGFLYGVTIYDDGVRINHEVNTGGWSTELNLYDVTTFPEGQSLVAMRRGDGKDVLIAFNPVDGFKVESTVLPTGLKSGSLDLVDLGDGTVRLFWAEGSHKTELKFADFTYEGLPLSAPQVLYADLLIGDLDVFDVSEVQDGKVVIARSDADGIHLNSHYIADMSVFNPIASNIADALLGSDFNDVISAFAGDDTVTGNGGNDQLHGGEGFDTAVYSGNQASYTVQLSASGVRVTDRRADMDGTDELIDFEALSFADRDFNLDIHSGAADLPAEDFAAIVELYIAYFNRAPASGGLLYWADRLADGMSLPQIAESFFVQRETQNTYAEYLSDDGDVLDAEALVTAVFNNVLGRDPNGPYWINELENNPDITPAILILAVLNGAKAPTGGAADREYLADKIDIGIYFSAVKGLGQRDDTIEVMGLYDGTDASVDAAIARTDSIYADALDADDGQFLLQLVGVVDDPFAIA